MVNAIDVSTLPGNAPDNIAMDLQVAARDYARAAAEQCRPCVIHRPTISQDGDAYCALLGENLQTGICGFGATPEEACKAFDRAWRGEDA